ncbi:hypothetical protein FRC04_010721 [Tulasnella sp. 424]|nr:hypothetical protein FRC04_010721 [Tulasnella sp. 424]KAG8962754.1 hypothetical protein FRC05_005120 [Tulasnella sp. 425]
MQGLKQASEQCAAEFWEAFQRLDGMLDTGSESGFEGIDALLKRFDSFKATFDDLVRQTEVKPIRQRNALLPIQKLPDELLQLIFHLLLFTTTGLRRSHYVRRISTLRAVSWSWRNLIDRAPLFWAHISSKDHADFVSEALEKSLNLPLHVRSMGSDTHERELAFLDKVFAHRHRWESVAIHEPQAELVQTYFHFPAPTLKKLLLSTDSRQPSEGAGFNKVFGGELENLEVLRAVRWKTIEWSDTHFTQLRVLEIEDYDRLNMGAIFNILAGNPCLEVFRLDFIAFAPYTPPHPIPSPIALESLQELTWTNVRQEVETPTGGSDVALTRILQRIRVPTCSKFEVDSWLQDGSGVSPEELVRLILPPMQVTARTTCEKSNLHPIVVDASFGESEFQLKASRGVEGRREASRGSCSTPSFSIKVGALPRSIAKRWMTDQLGGESARTLELRLSFEYAEGGPSLGDVIYFQEWESVSKLDINGGSESQQSIARELFLLLSTPCDSANGVKIMPFPALQTLRLSNLPFKGKDLVASMTARFGSDTTIASGDGVSALAALSIILADGAGGRTEEYLDKIRAIPGIKALKLFEEKAFSLFGEPPTIHDTSSILSVSDWPPLGPFIEESGNSSESEGDAHSENHT